MAKVNATATVPAIPARTWAVASDLSRFDEWMSLHDGWRGEVPSVIEEGTALTSVVSVMGLRNRIRWRVESYAPPSGLSISGRGVGGVRVSLTLSIRAVGESVSEVNISAEVTGRPVFGPIGMAVGRAVRADVRRSVATLANLVR
ncbi:type II toxin-antitoxin system Rv0910 family toxin [Actinophytocola oryzae]|uniref:type II toxin-antitoxin system Rv0910 family toxin n=1 Tax=Actinophytocola oryzae TaxID=502181 RepID=UPI00106324F4|nr:SRPBCC family protein [Actinophytocola oryzae]